MYGFSPKTAFRIVSAAALLVLVAGVCPALAGNPLSYQFDSRYKVNGQTVNAHIVLYGDGTGCYTLDDGAQGDLTVRFHGGSNGPQGPQSPRYYTGTWSLGGQGGTFRWNLYANDAAFVGSWYDDSGSLGGPWNGQM